MNKELKYIILVSLIVIAAYIAIVNAGLGPIPRHKTMDTIPSLKPAERLNLQNRSQSVPGELQKKDLEQSDTPEYIDQFDNPRNLVLARQISSRWVALGDILIEDSQIIAGTGGQNVKLAKIDKVRFWTSQVIPYTIEVDSNKHRVEKALRTFERFSSMKFREHAGEDDYLVFSNAREMVCQSYLGRKGGAQHILLHPSCSTGQVMHVIMHALGFVHEHNRADRNNSIKVHWKNIFESRKSQFQMLSQEISQPTAEKFDIYSILMYPPFSFSINNLATITTLDGLTYQANEHYLSEGDIAKIEAVYAETE